MVKSEVYSWRLSPDTKAALEAVAREQRSTVGGVLHEVVREWLRGRPLDRRDDGQGRLHAAAAKAFGTIRGGNPSRAERARELVRRRVKQRRAG